MYTKFDPDRAKGTEVTREHTNQQTDIQTHRLSCKFIIRISYFSRNFEMKMLIYLENFDLSRPQIMSHKDNNLP